MTASRAQRRAPSLLRVHDGDGTFAPRAAVRARTANTAANELLRSTFPADPSWAAAVRRTVADRLATVLPHPEQIDNAALATGELFANAVRHAGLGPGDTVTVAVECTEHSLRVIVADRSPVPPRPQTTDACAESGRGLAIVSALTDNWGIAPPEPGRPGKRVWFTMRRREVTP
ncbi:ATP-binding protein [Streptomyces sp. VMFN-G11Ma]|jgi:anti-sigma regulatory factor (Ser/Thr protein kinase)|uniref:ATP-binding protein n=1 Tax=Streptomyces sp. VMFN-G11Ma TaxID=2135609 RepID=UPI000D3687B0|nr:ATP-binding protein [Streptomyces sp. VMFN-G11Ma]PTM93946.1 anti-sigma regulatory factor (Ser/Thr protein kinase) [Streptomyces sp. VMFN-G11Ma]